MAESASAVAKVTATMAVSALRTDTTLSTHRCGVGRRARRNTLRAVAAIVAVAVVAVTGQLFLRPAVAPEAATRLQAIDVATDVAHEEHWSWTTNIVGVPSDTVALFKHLGVVPCAAVEADSQAVEGNGNAATPRQPASERRWACPATAPAWQAQDSTVGSVDAIEAKRDPITWHREPPCIMISDGEHCWVMPVPFTNVSAVIADVGWWHGIHSGPARAPDSKDERSPRALQGAVDRGPDTTIKVHVAPPPDTCNRECLLVREGLRALEAMTVQQASAHSSDSSNSAVAVVPFPADSIRPPNPDGSAHPTYDYLHDVPGIADADFVLWMRLDTPWDPPWTPAWPTSAQVPDSKLAVVDFADTQAPAPKFDRAYAGYFKRSWVRRAEGDSGEPARHLPGSEATTYSMLRSFLPGGGAVLPPHNQRRHAIVCTLGRAEVGGVVKHEGVRMRVFKWLRDDMPSQSWAPPPDEVMVGPPTNGGRSGTADEVYMNALRDARIVVTAQPADWEGDSRLWEAMASGALVFTDASRTPYSHFPLRDGEHVVTFDGRDQDSLFGKLQYYLGHPDEAQALALRGFLFAARFHRPASRMDAMLSTLVKRQAAWARGDGVPFKVNLDAVIDGTTMHRVVHHEKPSR